jgi:hypothetical protein
MVAISSLQRDHALNNTPAATMTEAANQEIRFSI